jgi:hypothetical protein
MWGEVRGDHKTQATDSTKRICPPQDLNSAASRAWAKRCYSRMGTMGASDHQAAPSVLWPMATARPESSPLGRTKGLGFSWEPAGLSVQPMVSLFSA